MNAELKNTITSEETLNPYTSPSINAASYHARLSIWNHLRHRFGYRLGKEVKYEHIPQDVRNRVEEMTDELDEKITEKRVSGHEIRKDANRHEDRYHLYHVYINERFFERIEGLEHYYQITTDDEDRVVEERHYSGACRGDWREPYQTVTREPGIPKSVFESVFNAINAAADRDFSLEENVNSSDITLKDPRTVTKTTTYDGREHTVYRGIMEFTMPMTGKWVEDRPPSGKYNTCAWYAEGNVKSVSFRVQGAKKKVTLSVVESENAKAKRSDDY